MDTLCKPNFMFLGHTVLEKNAMISCKIHSCTFALINIFEILQVSIAFFSDTVWPRTLKFFFYINPYKYSTQTKFHIPRSHSFREKCDDILKLASHFSPILCDRGTWNFFCILTHMDTLCIPNFMFLGNIIFEKNAMITCNNSRLICKQNFKLIGRTASEKSANFLKFYKIPSHFSPILCERGTGNFFCILTHMDTLCKPNFMFLRHTVFEKNAMISWKNSKLYIRPNKQLWNFTS